MAHLEVMDRAYHFSMSRMVGTGVAAHYTEVAAQLGCGLEEARLIVHSLMDPLTPGWVHPETDWIATFTPFASIPTQYRITVEGQQKWFGQ